MNRDRLWFEIEGQAAYKMMTTRCFVEEMKKVEGKDAMMSINTYLGWYVE